MYLVQNALVVKFTGCTISIRYYRRHYITTPSKINTLQTYVGLLFLRQLIFGHTCNLHVSMQKVRLHEVIAKTDAAFGNSKITTQILFSYVEHGSGPAKSITSFRATISSLVLAALAASSELVLNSRRGLIPASS